MVDLGEANEQVVDINFILKQGTDTFKLKKNIRLHIGRPKNRNATPAGPVITYGAGDHFCEATIIGSTPEITTLNAKTERDSNGALPSEAWSLVATPIGGGAAVTTSFTGEMPEFDMIQTEEGKLEFDIHIDITTDTVTVT